MDPKRKGVFWRSKGIADIDQLSEAFSNIQNFSLQELRAKARLYFDHLIASYPNEPGQTGNYLETIKKDQTHLAQLDRNQMQALVCLQYMKYALGRTNRMDASFFDTSLAKRGAS